MAFGRWGEVGVLALARVSMGAQLQVVGGLGPLLIGSLAADWTALGALIGAYSLAGVFVALPAGWLLARLGDRIVLLSGLGLMALGGLLLALAPGYGLALLARLVAGTGGALLTIAGAKMVLDRFSGSAVAFAMGLMLMAWPFGIGLALLVLPLLGGHWRLGSGSPPASAAWPSCCWPSPCGAAAARSRPPPGASGCCGGNGGRCWPSALSGPATMPPSPSPSASRHPSWWHAAWERPRPGRSPR